MKRLVISLLIIITVGAVGFFMGWVQLRVPPGSYGVLVTKTGGLHPEVLQAGSFLWRIEAVLPTNAKLHTFTDIEYQTTIGFTGDLPSGDLYGAELPGSPDFSFDLSFSVTFRIRPEQLPLLVHHEGLRPETVEQWCDARAQQIAMHAEDVVRRRPEEFLSSSAASMAGRLREIVAQMFPAVEVIAVRPLSLRYPDYELYRAAAAEYRELVAYHYQIQREILDSGRAERLQSQSEHERQMQALDVLSRYGEVLTQHPVLLKFLYLNSLTEIDSISIPEIPSPRIFAAPE